MAAATAAVTSMPGVFAPVVAARIELTLIDGVDELKIEDVLIVSYPLLKSCHRELAAIKALIAP